MATGFDDLVESLLYDVALSGSRGIGSGELVRAVKAFYEFHQPMEQPGPTIQDDLLFSEAPPTSTITVDDNLINAVWDWLDKHPDVQIRRIDDITEVPSNGEQRIFTTEERVWHVITGHGIDHQRVPPMEFACLSVVAAHGPEGVLQPDVTKITKQDKRSVPHRTDMLVAKGYIVKDNVLGKGTKTSLLRLRKFVTQQSAESGPVHARAFPENDMRNSRVVHYRHWYDSTIRQLQNNGNIITMEDLRIGLDICQKQWEIKALARCLKRLVKVGCIRKLRAKVQGEHSASTDVEYMRCVQLLREPTEEDRLAFIRIGDARIPKKGKQRADTGLVVSGTLTEAVDEDGESEDDEEDDLMPPMHKRIPPQWRPEVAYTNLLFNIINAAGPEGISSMDLNARSTGPIWRRPLDEIMGRLTDVWRFSQPSHLRHLAIVKDTAVQGRVGHFKYRTRPHFERAVETGLTEWAAVQDDTKAGKKKSAVPPVTEMDGWGFPKLYTHQFVGSGGRATLLQCQAAVRRDAKVLGRQAANIESGDASGAIEPDAAKRVESRTRTDGVNTLKRVLDSNDMLSPRTLIPRTKGLAASEDETKLYEANARVAAERFVRAEMTKGLRKRTFRDAELEDANEVLPNKAARVTSSASPTEAIGPIEDEGPMPARVRELEAEILARSKPGVYINPPGSKEMRYSTFVQLGRRKKAIIAVFKSERLKDFMRLEKDGVRMTPVASRRATQDGPAPEGPGEGVKDIEEGGQEEIEETSSSPNTSRLPVTLSEVLVAQSEEKDRRLTKSMIGQQRRRQRERLAKSAVPTSANASTVDVLPTARQIESPELDSSIPSTPFLQSTPRLPDPPNTSTPTVHRSGPASGTRRRSSAVRRTSCLHSPHSNSPVLNATPFMPGLPPAPECSTPASTSHFQTLEPTSTFPNRRGRLTKAMVAERERIRREQPASQDIVGISQKGSLSSENDEGMKNLIVKLPLPNSRKDQEQNLGQDTLSSTELANEGQDELPSMLVKLPLPTAQHPESLLQPSLNEESEDCPTNGQAQTPNLIAQPALKQALLSATDTVEGPVVEDNPGRLDIIEDDSLPDSQITESSNRLGVRDHQAFLPRTLVHGLSVIRPYVSLTANKTPEKRAAVQSPSSQDQDVVAQPIAVTPVDDDASDQNEEAQPSKKPDANLPLSNGDIVMANEDDSGQTRDIDGNPGHSTDVTEDTVGDMDQNLPLLNVDVSDYTRDYIDRAQKTTGMHRQGGTTRLQRVNIVMGIMEKMGGAYGGDTEIWYPFVTAWQKYPDHHTQTPDRNTVENVVKGLVAQGKLKRYEFTFQDRRGKVEKRHILTLPHTDPDSSPVKKLQQGIIDHHPRYYLPPETEISDGIRELDTRNPMLHRKRKDERDEFLEDDDVAHGPPKKKAALPFESRDGFPFDQEVTVKRTPEALRVINIELESRNHQRAGVGRAAFLLHRGDLEKLHTRGGEYDEQHSDENDYDDLEVSEEQAAKSFDFQLDSYRFDPAAVPNRPLMKSQPRSSFEVVGHEVQQPKIPKPRKRLGGLRTPLVKRRPTAKTWGGKTRGTMASDVETHRSLLMCPGQAFHKASGTFSTLSVASGRLQEGLGVLEMMLLRNKSVNIRLDTDRVGRAASLSLGQESAKQRTQNAQSWDQYMHSYLSMSTLSNKFPSVATRLDHPHDGAPIVPAESRTPSLKGKSRAIETELLNPSLPQDLVSLNIGKRKRPYVSRKNNRRTSTAQNYLEAMHVGNGVGLSTEDFPPVPKRPRKSTKSAGVFPLEEVFSARVALLGKDGSSGETTTAMRKPTITRNISNLVDCERLSIAMALVKTLCGGGEDLPWDIIAHTFSFRYEVDSLKKQWTSLAKNKSTLAFVETLQGAIHEPFLEAHETGSLPDIDFDNLHQTDWPALVRWVESEILPLDGVEDLPKSRTALQCSLMVELPMEPNRHDRSKFFESVNDTFRSQFATKLPFTNFEPSAARSAITHQSTSLDQNFMLAKSSIRAVAMTRDRDYDEMQAGLKLRIFDGRTLHQARREMEETNTLRAVKTGRQRPGRNFHIYNHTLSQFNRWPGKTDELKFLRQVANARAELMRHYQEHDSLEVKPEVTEEEMLVLTNMVAQGYLRVAIILPERNDDRDAPLPSLSAWGHGSLKHDKWVDKSHFAFTTVYEKTSTFTPEHDLRTDVPIPRFPPAVVGEAGFRTPFWVDIHGDILEDVWDMVLRSVLHLLVYRPGSTAEAMEQAHKTKLWAWEIELVLGWMEKVGLAQRYGLGVEQDGVWKGGWRAGEWWYCALSPEVAAWKAPAGTGDEMVQGG